MTCANGLLPDLALYHLPTSCLLPPNALFGLFIECVILSTIFSVLILLRRRASQREARNVLNFTLALVLLNLVVGLGEYLQGGMYEVALVAIILLAIVESHLAKMWTHMALRPTILLDASSPQPRVLVHWHRFSLVMNLLLGGAGVTALVFARRTPESNFNYCIVALSFITLAFTTTLSSIMAIYIHRLEIVIRQVDANAPTVNTGRTDQLVGFAHRLRFLRRLTLVFAVSDGVPLLTLPVTYLSVGTFPNAWVFVIVLVQANYFVAASNLWFLRTKSPYAMLSSTTSRKSRLSKSKSKSKEELLVAA